MITFLKLCMHLLMTTSNGLIMAFFWLFYCKKKNHLLVMQAAFITVSLIILLKTLNMNFSTVNYNLFNWRFPCYEIIMPIVFYTLLLKQEKYKHIAIVMGILMILMCLDGLQNVESLLFNLSLSGILVFFIKSVEKTFSPVQQYLVFVMLSISVIPFRMGYYTYDAVVFFWLMVLTYPVCLGLKHLLKGYHSSLFSRIS